MIKKLVLLIFILSSFVACGGSSSNENPNPSGDISQLPTSTDIVIPNTIKNGNQS